MKQKIKIWFILVFMATVMLSLGSCGGGGDMYYGPPDTTPGTIELINNSSVAINGFYLSSSWDFNILSSPLFSGQTTFIVDNFPGYYDAEIWAARVESNYYAYRYDIPITPGGIVPLIVYNSDFTGSLEIRNNTIGAIIIGVYVVPSTAPTWGTNQISSSIGPLNSRQLTDLDPGFYDVLIDWNVGPDTRIDYIAVNSLTLIPLDVD